MKCVLVSIFLIFLINCVTCFKVPISRVRQLFKNQPRKSILSISRYPDRQFQISSFNTLSLDSPVIPRGPFLANSKLFPLTACFVLLILVSKLAPSFITGNSVSFTEKISFYSNIIAEKIDSIFNLFKTGIIPNILLGIRVLKAKLALVYENLQRRIHTAIYGDDLSEVDMETWNLCSLVERESLMGKYLKYRFAFSDSNAVIPLFAGQDMVLCSVDGKDRILKESFFPVSDPDKRGSFDIIVRRNPSELMEEKFSKTLESLSIGDEVAFKGGRSRLKFPSNVRNRSSQEVREINIIGSGLGIAPSLQILRRLLSAEDTTVSQIEFIWINEHRNDFVLANEVENLELKHFEKFVTTKVLEGNLFGVDLNVIPEINNAIPAYSGDQIAIVCAPDIISEYLMKLLVTKKYPQECILVINTPV